jgi:hypothetical protein
MNDPTDQSILDNLSKYLHYTLLKANKRCTACQLICFDDEAVCPDCNAYSFEPYTKHLENYHPSAAMTDDIEVYPESELI